MPRTNIKPKKKQVPKDDASFAAYVRSLTARIRTALKHLRETSRSHDLKARRGLEHLIEARGQALSVPPETVSGGQVSQLRQEIASGQ